MSSKEPKCEQAFLREQVSRHYSSYHQQIKNDEETSNVLKRPGKNVRSRFGSLLYIDTAKGFLMEKAWRTFRARRHFVIKPKKLTLSPNPNLNSNPSPNPKPNLNPNPNL